MRSDKRLETLVRVNGEGRDGTESLAEGGRGGGYWKPRGRGEWKPRCGTEWAETGSLQL